MSTFDKYQRTTENIKDKVLEENRFLTRKLAEAQQSFELLRFVNFDKTINLEMLNDIIVGCTGCLYSVMFFEERIITNLDSENPVYREILINKDSLSAKKDLFIMEKFLGEFTVVVYPVCPSQMVSESNSACIQNVILVYPERFVTDETFEFIKSFMIVNDVLINIVLMRERMFELIETDPLTHLLNRSSWNNSLRKLSQNNKSFFIMFMDIDNFKTLNDTYGHQKGDEVLKVVGLWLKNNFRASDKLYRIGGDEFAVIGSVDSSTVSGLEFKLGKLNESFNETVKIYLGLGCTISIGAFISSGGNDIQTIYSKVDELLYKSKEKGRNCITIFSDL